MRLKPGGPVPCVRIYAEDLFEMPEFQTWMEDWTGAGLATWHVSGESPGEYSDVFILYDHGEGPESPDVGESGMPQECWDLLCKFCKENHIDYAILWLINV